MKTFFFKSIANLIKNKCIGIHHLALAKPSIGLDSPDFLSLPKKMFTR